MEYMSEGEMIANTEAAAQRLTGIPVTVRIQKPNGANGCARKDVTGRVVVDLDPALLDDIKNFAYILCHELAHVKLHHRDMIPIDVNARPQLSDKAAVKVDLYRKQTNPQVMRRESEADKLAGQWMEVIKQYYSGYSVRNHPIMAVLKILYHKTGR